MGEYIRNVGCSPIEGEPFPRWLKCVRCGYIEKRRQKHQRHCHFCAEARAGRDDDRYNPPNVGEKAA